jgi:deoxyribodipyrimidine photo-lyase
MKPEVNVMWCRRDLRLHDNAALYHALGDSKPVVPIFIFDTNILDKLEDKVDRRVEFIHAAITELQLQLITLESSLEVYYGNPNDIFNELLHKYEISKVFTNHDYEPYAIERDDAVLEILKE